MAGLLDFLQTPESRFGIGLLAAAGPRADGAGFGQRLNEAMAMQDAYGQNQMRAKLLQSQMEEHDRKTQEAMQQKQAQAALQAAIPGLYSQGEGGRTGAFDVQRALQLGLTPDQISKYASVPDAGRQEVARTIETMDAQGRPVTLQTDKFGGTVGQGLSKFLAPLMVNQGGKINAVDPATLQSRGSFDIGMSPSERDASARGWAGNAIQRERLAFDKTKPAEAEKPVWDSMTGSWVYRPSADAPTGRSVKIDGYTKPLNDIQAKAQLFGSRMQEADKILNDLAASGKDFATPLANAPIIGGAINLIDTEKGQQARQAQRDFLNAVLRRESGAAIAPSEFDSGSKQYFPQPGDGPAVIAQKARNRSLAVRGILAEVPSTAPPIPDAGKQNAPKVPMKGQTVNGYKFKGGDPADQNNWEKM